MRIISLCSLLIALLIYSPLSIGQQRAEAFIVDIYDKKVKVVAPEKNTKNMHAIIKNNTLTTIRGKVQTSDNYVLDYVTLHEGESKSVKLGLQTGKKIYFFPLSPSFQEVELAVGRKAYEIPPKK